MPKPFKEIFESKMYQAAPKEERVAVREDYFNKHILPKVMAGGDDPVEVLDDFTAKYDLEHAPEAPASVLSQVGDKAKAGLTTMRGKLNNIVNDVDRETGINHIAFRGDLSTMTGTKEKSNFLNDIIGSKNWGVGNRGETDFVIKSKEGLDRLELGHLWKGKPIAIDERGVSLSDFFGDTRGAAVPMLGAMGAGLATGGLGFVPAMAASGLGGAIGKGLDELRQTYQDKGKYQLQSAGEVGKDMAVEGAFAAGGEGIGRALRPLGRALMGPNLQRGFKAFGKQPKPESVVKPALRANAAQAAEKGVSLPITQATGKNKLLGFFQRMSDTIVGDPRAVKNAQAINKWGKSLTGHDIGSNISQQQFGEGLGKQFATQAKQLSDAKNMLTKSVRQKLGQVQNKLRGGKLAVGDDMGESIRNTIVSAHDDFMEASSMLYAQPLTKVGGGVNSKIFSSQAIKQVAKNKMGKMLETQSGEKFSTATNEVMSKLKKFSELEDTVSFNQLTEFRKDLGKAAYTGNLHSDVASHDAMDFLRAVDDTIDNFAVDTRHAGTGKMLPHKWKDIVQGFREANVQYGKGIKPFNDVLVKSITKDLTQRGAVQPSMVVNAMKGAPKENISQLMNLIEGKNPALAQQVKAQFFDAVVWNKTIMGEELVPSQLAKNIAGLKPGVLERMYKGEAKEIRKLAGDLNKFAHGNLVVDDAIREGGVTQMLGKLVEKTRTEEAFLKGNFASLASKGQNIGGSEYGKIVDMAMNDAGYAKELLALSTPKQISQAQNIMMQKLLNKMSDHSKPLSAMFKETALQQELARMGAFTAKEGDNALKIFLGPEKFKGLTDIARVAASSVTEGNSGLVAMNIALNPFAHMGRLAEVNILSRWLGMPGVVKWFVEGSKSPGWRAGGDAMVRTITQKLAADFSQITNDVSFKEEMKKLEGQKK